jgi:hypothetical protein
MEHDFDQHQEPQAVRSQFDLERISARILSAQPPARRPTNREAIEALKPTLAAALNAGHTPASLAALLKQDGLKIAPRTLATWLKVQTTTRATRKSTRRPSQAQLDRAARREVGGS